ncbi:MAG: hypothetical protein HDS64_00310 [Bacteroidales bacterium]|nr:hypothetical protein [Bacteroidales bacterium]MBD5360741.1 hypothetical protein [Bacteroides sp.]MDE6033149.1 hypothetical protein [Muribaculaceae bacterium]MBD5362692.1 hypothetical protein [Bacteroides sp.]MBD5364846.1 hypothetical protein [Bacteroides sp.]
MENPNEEVKKSTHGGKRAGAGRPKTIGARNSIGFRVPDDIVEILKRQKNQSAFVIEAIRAADRKQRLANGEE